MLLRWAWIPGQKAEGTSTSLEDNLNMYNPYPHPVYVSDGDKTTSLNVAAYVDFAGYMWCLSNCNCYFYKKKVSLNGITQDFASVLFLFGLCYRNIDTYVLP